VYIYLPRVPTTLILLSLALDSCLINERLDSTFIVLSVRVSGRLSYRACYVSYLGVLPKATTGSGPGATLSRGPI
jgi:hypothetical protein